MLRSVVRLHLAPLSKRPAQKGCEAKMTGPDEASVDRFIEHP
jgi:hypothetical protein